MFDIGLQEMVVIGVLALLVFGPGKLPELGRTIGKALREFRRASDEFRTTVETNLHINDPDPVLEPSPPPPVTESAVALDVTATAQGETGAAEGAPAVAAEIAEPFCAQRTSRLFHRRDCVWVSRIPEIERVYLKRVADARDQGFVTCPVCEPWEPTS
ncbi:MAG: twin-arginine translocase TatA/TatE family subunit [Candidatus Rokubacteria bacterium]|nr:twin-arginine translocase TatA/TatE family subunit [Candidatus Rokubacteria bacterium]